MRVIAFDTETCLIRPAQMAPPLVCVTWQESGKPACIEHHSTVEPRLRAWLQDPDVLLVGHNVAFDLAVVCERFPHLVDLIFAAYRAGRITDTMIRQQLLDIAAGVYRGRVDAKGRRVSYEYSLEALAKRCAGMILAKDGWRLSYSEFIDVPLNKWPVRAREVQEKARPRLAQLERAILDAAKSAKDKPRVKALKKERDGLAEMIAGDPNRCSEYPLDDARAPLAVYFAQEKHVRFLADQFRQARAAWALYLNSCWGICVDAEGVEILEAQVQAERDELEEELQMLGLVREDGTRDTKVAKARMIRVCKEEGIPIIRTEAHFKDGAECNGADDCEEHVCLDADACERTGDEVLIAYAERTTLTKQLTNDIPALKKGTLYPIHTRYGLAATGRSTSSKPNIQNQSKREGYREAFIARPGMLFMQCDYPTLELYTLAQCCISWLGQSKLAETLRAGRDPHLAVAAVILQKSYEWCEANKDSPEVEKARQLAKPANFGFPGGMGIKKFVTATRKTVVGYGGRAAWEALGLTEARARQLKEQWFTAFPEMPYYFARVNALCDTDDGRASVETLFTERWRGQATYCATSNNGFQALGADCAKNAAWLIAEAQYTDRKSPLYNTRTVAFVHDEFIGEVRDDERAHAAAYALAERMAAGANEFLPDVPIPLAKLRPLLMKRWSKKAKPRFDHNERLIAWAA
jgi:hypothetical protein